MSEKKIKKEKECLFYLFISQRTRRKHHIYMKLITLEQRVPRKKKQGQREPQLKKTHFAMIHLACHGGKQRYK